MGSLLLLLTLCVCPLRPLSLAHVLIVCDLGDNGGRVQSPMPPEASTVSTCKTLSILTLFYKVIPRRRTSVVHDTLPIATPLNIEHRHRNIGWNIVNRHHTRRNRRRGATRGARTFPCCAGIVRSQSIVDHHPARGCGRPPGHFYPREAVFLRSCR